MGFLEFYYLQQCKGVDTSIALPRLPSKVDWYTAFYAPAAGPYGSRKAKSKPHPCDIVVRYIVDMFPALVRNPRTRGAALDLLGLRYPILMGMTLPSK